MQAFFLHQGASLLYLSLFTLLQAHRKLRGAGGGEGFSPPLVNPISIRGTGYAHHSNPKPPPPDFQTLLRPCADSI